MMREIVYSLWRHKVLRYDGDTNFITDNEILVRHTERLRTIFCVQHRAEKHVINRDLLIESNIVGFGNKIGKITNDITSQFDIISYYDRNSVEWQELDYRIKCGQMAQQNDIDKLFVSSY